MAETYPSKILSIRNANERSHGNSDQAVADKTQAPSGDPATQIVTLEVTTGYKFSAGQYLTVVHKDDTHIPLSIASAPSQLPILELHYRSTPGLAEARAMDAALTTAQLDITAAAGDVNSGDPDRALVVIAGGSGAAQGFSCLRHRAHIAARGKTTMLWMAAQTNEIYFQDELGALANTQLICKVDDQRTPQNEGLVWLRSNPNVLVNAKIVLAGSPGFVYSATDTLLAMGIAQDEMTADVYAYAPRT